MEAHEIFHKNFAALIDAYKESGASQTSFAQIAGLSQGQVSNFYTGESYPTLPILDRIAKAFGVSLSDLFKNDRTPVAKPHVVTPREALKILEKLVVEKEKSPDLFDRIGPDLISRLTTANQDDLAFLRQYFEAADEARREIKAEMAEELSKKRKKT